MKSTAAILPALNEAASIYGVITTLREFVDVVVVDDGSSDRTSELAAAAGAFVVSHQFNRGYDQALETGLFWAIANGYKYAVTLDADGQHRPDDIALFEQELLAGADVVIGVRDKAQRWAETVFSVVSIILWGVRDPLCGMKGYRLELFKSVGQLDTYSSVGTELCIRAARSNCRIQQVHLSIALRAGESRFGGGLGANIRILRSLVLGLFRAKVFSSGTAQLS